MHSPKILLPSAVLLLLLAAASTRADSPHPQVPCLSALHPSNVLDRVFILNAEMNEVISRKRSPHLALMGHLPTCSPKGTPEGSPTSAPKKSSSIGPRKR